MNLVFVLLFLPHWINADLWGPSEFPFFDDTNNNSSGLLLNPHIIGGKPAALGQFPWQVATQPRTADGYYFCAGVLVHKNWILTAAHCTDGAMEIKVRMGMIDLNVKVISFTLSAANIYQHPAYDSEFIKNDISLLKTPDVKVTKDAKVIRILPKYWKSLGRTLTASGWGKTCDADPCTIVRYLNYAVVQPITNDECKIVWGDLIAPSVICTLGLNGGNEEPCRGDSGGPLVKLGSNNYLVGLSSFGARYCEEGWPSAYTRVNEFCEWITEVTKLKFC